MSPSQRPIRTVVVGHGMVGNRFCAELLSRNDDRELSVTVIGGEPHRPYHRVQLSEVVAGRAGLMSLALPESEDPRLTVIDGPAVRVDRTRRTVSTADATVGYDRLVFATGASARIPDVPGLQPMPAGVHALRTLDDAREILAALANAPRAVVLGGGVLGVEVAAGLAGRGIPVSLVHHGEAPMQRQLGPGAPAVAGLLVDRGVELVGGSVAEVVSVGGRVGGVRVLTSAGDGVLPADLLVVCCGTDPDTALAAGAGLAVDHGIIVDDELASITDPSIHAIGDVAQPPGGASGLIAQGWEQARRLAARLSGEPDPGLAESADVLRVKGLDVLSLGSGGAAGRTLSMSDPWGRRHLQVTVRDGRVASAVCVGGGRVAADLTSAYLRGTPLPMDPAHLLVQPIGGPPVATSPTLMPDAATVCTCNGVSKRAIVTAFASGARTVPAIAAATRATTGCGGCQDTVCGLVEWLDAADPEPADNPPETKHTREGNPNLVASEPNPGSGASNHLAPGSSHD